MSFLTHDLSKSTCHGNDLINNLSLVSLCNDPVLIKHINCLLVYLIYSLVFYLRVIFFKALVLNASCVASQSCLHL